MRCNIHCLRLYAVSFTAAILASILFVSPFVFINLIFYDIYLYQILDQIALFVKNFYPLLLVLHFLFLFPLLRMYKPEQAVKSLQWGVMVGGGIGLGLDSLRLLLYFGLALLSTGNTGSSIESSFAGSNGNVATFLVLAIEQLLLLLWWFFPFTIILSTFLGLYMLMSNQVYGECVKSQ